MWLTISRPYACDNCNIIIIIFKSLHIDKSEWLEDIERGDSSSASNSFLACVEECISERESKRFEEELNMKVKINKRPLITHVDSLEFTLNVPTVCQSDRFTYD